MKKSLCFSVLAGLASAIVLATLLLAAPAPAADDAAWAKVLKIAGARVPADKGLVSLLGPLPGESTLARCHALSPSAFAAQYNSADGRTRLLMERFARSRLRELGRRGIINDAAMAELLGPEPEGVSGSRFFGIVPVPAEAYHALINYLEFSASLVPGSTYQPSDENRKKIDRAMQDSLALSSADGRIQYADFDVVWSWLGMKTACPGADVKAMAPGLLWLYDQVREPADLSFLPPLSPDLAARVNQEQGKLFLEARQSSASLPPSLAALTQWQCGP
jgi:hypothetical protein